MNWTNQLGLLLPYSLFKVPLVLSLIFQLHLLDGLALYIILLIIIENNMYAINLKANFYVKS